VRTSVGEALYREFAAYYDQIYSYKDTAKEIKFVVAAMKRHGVKGRDLLDVACGTGRHAKLLVGMGYRVIGLDKHKEILRLARRKAPRVTFKQGDMRSFRLPQRFDAILCMFTSINYNTSMKDLVRTLRGFRRHLKDGGIIVFDGPIASKGRPTEALSGDVLDQNAAVLYIWKDHGRLTEGTLYWIVKGGAKRGTKDSHVLMDRHILRFYELREISQALKAAGLAYDICWDFSLARKRGHRPVFVCWKA